MRTINVDTQFKHKGAHNVSNKHIAVSESISKFIINKELAKAYLDKNDYEKLIDIIGFLRICDKIVGGVVTSENKIRDSQSKVLP